MRQAGRLSPDEKPTTILKEQTFQEPGRAASYKPGDVIQYTKGSPKNGLLHNSEAVIEAVDSRRNILTVRNGQDQVSYNPALLKTPTNESRVYRPEQREIATGERIRFTKNDKEQGLRAGDFATVTRTQENGNLKVRLDSGKEVELTSRQARHIDHGYTADSGRRVSAERFIVTGEQAQVNTLKAVPPSAKELSVHTATPSIQREKATEKDLAQKPPQQEIQRGYGIGLSL